MHVVSSAGVQRPRCTRKSAVRQQQRWDVVATRRTFEISGYGAVMGVYGLHSTAVPKRHVAKGMEGEGEGNEVVVGRVVMQTRQDGIVPVMLATRYVAGEYG